MGRNHANGNKRQKLWTDFLVPLCMVSFLNSQSCKCRSRLGPCDFVQLACLAALIVLIEQAPLSGMGSVAANRPSRPK